MGPVVSLAVLATTGFAFTLGLALGRRLISPVRFVQIIGGLGCGLFLSLTAVRLMTGGRHG